MHQTTTWSPVLQVSDLKNGMVLEPFRVHVILPVVHQCLQYIKYRGSCSIHVTKEQIYVGKTFNWMPPRYPRRTNHVRKLAPKRIKSSHNLMGEEQVMVTFTCHISPLSIFIIHRYLNPWFSSHLNRFESIDVAKKIETTIDITCSFSLTSIAKGSGKIFPEESNDYF